MLAAARLTELLLGLGLGGWGWRCWLGRGWRWRRWLGGQAGGGLGWRGLADGRGLGLGHFVALGYELYVEDEDGLGWDDGRAAGFAVAELVGDVEATFAADVHALEGGVPTLDNAVLTVGEGDGFAAVDGGVEFGAVGEIAGVVDGVELAGLGESSGTEEGIDVDEGVGDLFTG